MILGRHGSGGNGHLRLRTPVPIPVILSYTHTKKGSKVTKETSFHFNFISNLKLHYKTCQIHMSKTNSSWYPETAALCQQQAPFPSSGRVKGPPFSRSSCGASRLGHHFLVPGEQHNKNLPAYTVLTPLPMSPNSV